MNKVILIGRLTADPDMRFSQGENETGIARYSLAVTRRFKKDETDFINCVAFGKSAEFAEKYLYKGMKIAVIGRIKTGSYTNREGKKVYTTDVIVEEQEFVEKKGDTKETVKAPEPAQASSVGDGFMDIPDNIDEELPWN